MAEKKIVDDYYSNVKSNSWDNKTKNTDSKPKIKAKKIVKKVVKKVEDKKDSSTISDSKKSEERKENTNRSSFNKNSNSNSNNSFKRKENNKKPFVQKMGVVKTEERKSSVIWHAPEKKSSNWYRGKPNPNYKGKNNNPNYKWNNNFSNNSGNNKTEERQKNYWEDKQKGGLKKWERKNYNNSQSAWKKAGSFSKWKTRGRFKFYDNTPKDTSFTRSTKIEKKQKEEKKIEDIKQTLISKTWETVVISDVFSLKEFSEKIWVPLVKLIAEFMKNGMMVNINSKIDFDSASIIAEAFEVKLQKDDSKWVSVKDLMTWNIADLLIEDDKSKLKPRPPVVSIMGHVDHGKTSLLDSIRKAKVADGEAGWITQSIWAYQVEHDGKKLTFLDTPGHEAFTVMRSRWARATDIAILVVAADEWVKPQTIESISHAKEAGIPVIVAINKMDKEWANPDHLKW